MLNNKDGIKLIILMLICPMSNSFLKSLIGEIVFQNKMTLVIILELTKSETLVPGKMQNY